MRACENVSSTRPMPNHRSRNEPQIIYSFTIFNLFSNVSQGRYCIDPESLIDIEPYKGLLKLASGDLTVTAKVSYDGGKVRIRKFSLIWAEI